jgi:Mrp family chromosome partitioning ATPase
MSTFLDLLPQTLKDACEARTVEIESEASRPLRHAAWDADAFAEEQIRGLVRQVFFPGWPQPAHQVVFSSVDPETDISGICMQVGLALSAQVLGATCLVDANLNGPGLEPVVERNGHDLIANHKRSVFRDSRRKSDELWLVPKKDFFAESSNRFSGDWLQDRLAELRKTFDYSILYGPPAATGSEAALLGSLCDGVVLVVEANSTRRVAAQKVKEKLREANACLLGTVLCGRTFPIPDIIYKKL